MSWDVQKEKLLSHIVLDDRYAKRLSPGAGDAYFRAFIVEDRKTGQLTLKFRFKYRDGKRNWFTVTPKIGGEAGLAELQNGIVQVLETGAALYGRPLPEGAVKIFNPPDDRGDGHKTIQWLADLDLIEVTQVEVKGGAS